MDSTNPALPDAMGRVEARTLGVGAEFKDNAGYPWRVLGGQAFGVLAEPIGERAHDRQPKNFALGAMVWPILVPAPGPEEAGCGCGQPHGAPEGETGLPAFSRNSIGEPAVAWLPTPLQKLPPGAYFSFGAEPASQVHEVTSKNEPEALLPVTVQYGRITGGTQGLQTANGSIRVWQLTYAPTSLGALSYGTRFSLSDRRVYEKSHRATDGSAYCARVDADGGLLDAGMDMGLTTIVRPLVKGSPLSLPPKPIPAPVEPKARLHAVLYGRRLEPDVPPPFTHLLDHELEWIEDQSKADAEISSRDAAREDSRGWRGDELRAKALADYHAFCARVYEVKAERCVRQGDPNLVTAGGYRGRAQVERELARHYASKAGVE